MRNLIAVDFHDGSALTIEGFGPQTILGAVADILDGNYNSEPEYDIADGTTIVKSGKTVIKVTIT